MVLSPQGEFGQRQAKWHMPCYSADMYNQHTQAGTDPKVTAANPRKQKHEASFSRGPSQARIEPTSPALQADSSKQSQIYKKGPVKQMSVRHVLERYVQCWEESEVRVPACCGPAARRHCSVQSRQRDRAERKYERLVFASTKTAENKPETK